MIIIDVLNGVSVVNTAKKNGLSRSRVDQIIKVGVRKCQNVKVNPSMKDLMGGRLPPSMKDIMKKKAELLSAFGA